MTERYYQRDFEELYYIIDSQVISEEEFDEKEMYEGYTAFEDSMTGEEIVKLLNENEQLKSDLDYFKAKNGSLETKMFNLERENKKLNSENNMLKVTIGRNEAYIKRLTSKGRWRTSI